MASSAGDRRSLDGLRRVRHGRRREARGRTGEAGGRAGRRGAASRRSPGRRARGRSALHVVHLARAARQASAVADPLRRRHARDTRLPARAASRRAGRPPASGRPLVQPRRRRRRRLLEQLGSARARAAREDGLDPPGGDRVGGGRQRAGHAARGRRVADARRDGGDPRADRLRLRRRPRPALDRPRHHAQRGQQARRVQRQQGRHPGAARRARARGALEGAARLHRREREADLRARARQRRRERRLHEQRGPEGRRGLGHACPLGGALGTRRPGRGRAAAARPPEEPRLPDLLARARLRPVRGQPPRREGLQQRQGAAEPRDRAGAQRPLPPPPADPDGPFSAATAEAAWKQFASEPGS